MRLIPARARALENEATRPVTEKSNGPSSLKQRHPAAETTPAGTAGSGQTTDSSSAVRVMETNGPQRAQAGTGAPLSMRHTANVAGRRVNARDGVATSLQDEQRRQDQGDRRQQLDQDVQRRSGGVLERIAHGVADHSGFVRLRPLPHDLAVDLEEPRLDVLLGVVPGAAAVVHERGHE